MKNAVRLLTMLIMFLAFPSSSHAAGLDGVVQWSTSRMETWSPPGRSFYPDAKETPSDGLVRYSEIARAAASVAFDPAEKPVFSGPDARFRTLAVMLAIADSESGYRKDVDSGRGSAARGDGGRSWCMMQIQLSTEDLSTHRTKTRIVLSDDAWSYAFDGKTGWGGEDLVQDRTKCFRAALHMIRVSMRACSYLPHQERLAVYTGGSCSYPEARKKSSDRMKKATSWLFSRPAPSDDAAIMTVLLQSSGLSALASGSLPTD